MQVPKQISLCSYCGIAKVCNSALPFQPKETQPPRVWGTTPASKIALLQRVHTLFLGFYRWALAILVYV